MFLFTTMVNENFLTTGFLNLNDHHSTNKSLWIAGKPTEVL